MNKTLRAKEILGKHISRQRVARQFRLPPERALAEQLGYSRATIGKALGALEGEGIVFRKKGSGTFITTEQHEQALKIALVMRTAYLYTDPHFRLIVDKILEYGKEHNISIQIFDHVNDIMKNDPDNNSLMRAINNKMIDGALIVSRMAVDVLGKISTRCPTVSINNVLGDGGEIPCISCDYFQAGFLAGKCLLEKGHRKVAYVTESLAHPESSFNFSGFRAAFDMFGIKLDKNNILETGRNANTFSERITSFFKNSDYTACFIRNAMYAQKTISVLQKNGIKIPEDLSVITNGNYDSNQPNGLKLTVIDTQLSQMCRIGLKILRSIIENSKTKEGGIRLLEPEIIERDSVVDINKK